MSTQNNFFNLTHLGLLSVSGPQAKKFLQGQLTCHLDEITSTESRLGAHCNPQGRVISLFRIFMHDDHYYLQMPRELISIAIKALEKYAVFFKVTLKDVSDQFKQLGYVSHELTAEPSENNIMIICMPGNPARYQLIGEMNNVFLNSQIISNDLRIWKSIDLAQFIAEMYPETSEKFLPHDLDLPKLNAVSFTKGCYTGQEIIARMQYKGKLKNHLYLAKIYTNLPIIRGANIYLDDKICGNIVDFCQIDYNHYELLVIAQEKDIETRKITLDLEKKYSLEFLK